MRPSWPRSRLRRRAVLAVPAALILSALPAASPAGAKRHTTASAPAPTRLTLEANRSSVRYGGRVVLTGKLTAAGKPLSGKVVELVRAGAVDQATTRRNGKVTFKPRPVAPNTYQLRFTPTAPEDTLAYQAAVSEQVTVRVRALVSMKLSSPLRARHRTVAIPRVRLAVRGKIKPVTADRVAVRVTRGRRVVKRATLTVIRRGSRGFFAFGFKPKKRGSYKLRASIAAGAGLDASRSRTERLLVVRSSAGQGSRGGGVRALQSRLSILGFRSPVTGSFGASTARAVLAFRKTNGMSRSSFASRAVFSRLEQGRGGFRLRYPKAGKHVEFDWSRQVLVLARGSRVTRALHASSGAPVTPTVFGHFRFYRKSPGYNAKGMYYSSYFIGGYAIHGYASVPTFPASHGCIRIPIASATSVYSWIDLGDPIYVYR
jgi:L,D-transpeptidase catalytic domain/Putative peptidoglycan binding domain